MTALRTDNTPTMSPAEHPNGPGPSSASSLLGSTRAELLRLRRWPVTWVLVGTWTLLNLLFVYGFNYLSYRTGDTASPGTQGVPADVLLAAILPPAVPESLVQGMPIFGGAILLILGALTVGSGYGWGTWKTALTQGPGRSVTFAGTLVSLAILVVGLVLTTVVIDLGVSSVLAAVESQPVEMPGFGDLAEAIGAAVLMLGMWTAFGVLIGVLTKSPAVAVGLGLVWSLVIENLLRLFTGLVDEFAVITDHLPGTAAGSLAGALGASGGTEVDATPGVLTTLGGQTASWVLLAYLFGFTIVSLLVMRRRDLA